MIKASFTRADGSFRGVTVTGHAGYRPHGGDIVCASVTSALQLTCNGITEVLKAPAEVSVEENLISVRLTGPHTQAAAFLQALYLHLELLREDYPQNLTTTVSEV